MQLLYHPGASPFFSFSLSNQTWRGLKNSKMGPALIFLWNKSLKNILGGEANPYFERIAWHKLVLCLAKITVPTLREAKEISRNLVSTIWPLPAFQRSYLVPVSVSRTSGHGLLDPMARRRASAAPASSDCEKSQRWSGPRWPAMPHSASANWNCRMVRVKYLREGRRRRN